MCVCVMGGEEGARGWVLRLEPQSFSLIPGLEVKIREAWWWASRGGGPGTSSGLRHSASPASALDSMEKLYEEMKLLAFDLQDNNRIIEG